MGIRTNFPRLAGEQIDYEARKRQAFLDQGIAIIDLTDSRIVWQDRVLIEQACERIYGKRERVA